MSEYTISPATPNDAPAIATLFAQSWTSPFTKLQFGTLDPATLASAIAPSIRAKLETPTNLRSTMIMRSSAGEVAAVAQWSLPLQHPEGEIEEGETSEQKAERQAFEAEVYRSNLPDGSNKDLVVEFSTALKSLRERTIQGRPHYLLGNIATLPDHRGRGLASRLLEWVFPLADDEEALVYLDTASDNAAMRLYKRLGFEEKGASHIEALERFGGVGRHTHVALVREPKKSA